ncbi:hypothetical protein BpHYR1_019292 [Brachionus plicatilis]|uniref:Uncharacterized protein n=1 Tax=Brachionus plicatilis TaxID=10195 RepID=A0A3M7RHW6_BRAPC|nr:hypothetical protein BpHYR1_019292 [Brachionus plicatilis]
MYNHNQKKKIIRIR